MKLHLLLAALALLLATAPGNAWLGRPYGGSPGSGGGPVLLGTITDANTGAAESNVPRRRGMAFARGQMPTVGGTNGSGTGSTFTDSTCSCFYPQDVGISLNITSPGSGLTTGTYIIASYVSASSVTLTPAPGVTLGTGSGASWMASTPVGSGYTFKLVDCNSNNLVYGEDQVSTYNGEAGSTDVQNIRHVVFSYIEPTIGAVNTTCPISIYKVTGTYSPGTPLPISAVTAAHNFIDYFGSSTYPVKDAANTVQGSGQYQFVFNTYAAAPFSASFGSTGLPGGYKVMLSSQDETCWDVQGALTDLTGGAVHPWLSDSVYVCAWEATPGSGTLGHTETMPLLRVAYENNPATVTKPSSYWGARSFYDGVQGSGGTLLRTWNQTYTFSPSDVTTGLPNGQGTVSGIISNPNNLQTAEPFVFNITGGGSNALPGGITAGQLSFVGSVDNSGTFTKFWVANTADFWNTANWVTLTSQGVCATGACMTMTRMEFVNVLSGDFLPADDVGNAFWSPARTAVLYPQMTTAERTAMMTAGMAPPYNLTPPVSAGTTVPFPTDWIATGAPSGASSITPTGPAYRPDSLGCQSVSIGFGGNHTGIGLWADWTADWFETQTAANWDYVRETALSREHMPVSEVENVGTGYLPDFDNGPNSAGAQYPTLGTPLHNDFNTNMYQGGLGTGYVGFATPVTPTFSSVQDWYYAVAIQNGPPESGSDHWPAMGQATMYEIEGAPWSLHEVYQNFNYHIATGWVGASLGHRGNPITIGSNNYYGGATLPFIGEQPRSGAWSVRSVVNAASLGADGNPEKVYAFSTMRMGLRFFYDVVNNYETNPNFAAFGQMGTQVDLTSNFMQAYYTMMAATLHDRFRQSESAILPGATSLYMLNYSVIQNAGNTIGSGMAQYWAALEDFTPTTSFTTEPLTPAAPWNSAWNQFYIWYIWTTTDAGGLFTMQGASSNDTLWGQYTQNGDEIKAWDDEGQGQSVAELGTSTYYVCNWNGTALTFNLSLSSGCGTLFVPTMARTFMELVWHPQASPTRGSPQDSGPNGYVALWKAQFNTATGAGSTQANLASALSIANSWYYVPNPVFYTPAQSGPPWMQWWMTNVTVQ